MTQSAIVFTGQSDGNSAGQELGQKILETFKDRSPHVVIVFASSVYDYDALLRSLKDTCSPGILVGSSSAGEFTSSDFGTDSASAIALYSTELQFRAGIGEGITTSRKKVAEQLFGVLSPVTEYQYRYYSAMIFADALSGYTDELIELLTEWTVGEYQFFGGGAGDNANFEKTHVFYDTQAYSDSAVILEILSDKPIGIGAAHGWKPAGSRMRVTETNGMKLISLNGRPAVDLFKDHAAATGQHFNPDEPIPFFLHNIIGIEVAGNHKLRVPLAVLPDGSIQMASEQRRGFRNDLSVAQQRRRVSLVFDQSSTFKR